MQNNHKDIHILSSIHTTYILLYVRAFYKRLILLIIPVITGCAFFAIDRNYQDILVQNYPKERIIENEGDLYAYIPDVVCSLSTDNNFNISSTMTEIGRVNDVTVYEVEENFPLEKHTNVQPCHFDGLVVYNLSTNKLGIVSGDIFIGFHTRAYYAMQSLQKENLPKQKTYMLLAIHIAQKYKISYISSLFEGEIAYMQVNIDNSLFQRIKNMRKDTWLSYVSMNITY